MKSESTLREFKPALRFVLIFVGIYLAGNIIYGVYVEMYKPSPDPMTVWVSEQVAFVVSKVNGPATAVVSDREPIVLLKQADPQPDGTTVLRVFEGCNGLNVMIVFASFIIAFGGRIKSILTFLLVGFFLLHIFNLLRIVLLYYTALYRPLFFYYFHKYFFTAVLYLAVFGLWIMWTRMKSKDSAAVQA